METSEQRFVKKNISKGAYLMSKTEALAHQWSLIADWKPRSEVWPLVHARGILAIAAGLSGAYINYLFRLKLRARSIGQAPTLIIITTSPAFFTGLCQSLILDNLLLLENTCTLCLEVKSALIQTSTGMFLPLFAVPLLNFFMIGDELHNVPHHHDVKKMFTVTRSIYRPLVPKLALIFTFHVLFSGFITNLQIKSFLRILDFHYLTDQEEKSTSVDKNTEK